MSGTNEVPTEYADSESSTTTQAPEPSVELDVEVEKYGTGKPRRTLIRARIAHGNED